MFSGVWGSNTEVSGKTKRKIFKLGRSHVITLPPEWISKQKTGKVLLLFNDYLLVVPEGHEDTIDQIIEEAIKEAVIGACKQ